jgi:hypothetical protein
MTTEHQSFGQNTPLDSADFLDRRSTAKVRSTPGLERRQFSDGHADLSADAAELGRAIDQYKLVNRRRYITYEEMLGVMIDLGYSKQA